MNTDFVDYCFCSSWDGDGEIYNVENKIVWRFQTTLKLCPPETKTNPPRVFVLSDADDQELVTIRQERRLPLARFVVMKNALRLGSISQRSIWFTKYDLELDDKLKWKLHMPMFSVSGKAVSDGGATIWWRARGRKQWFMRMNNGFDNPSMIASLAYVIRKKLQCT